MTYPPDLDSDPDGHAAWRHNVQMPTMAAMFPNAAALLPPCPVCDQNAAGHLS